MKYKCPVCQKNCEDEKGCFKHKPKKSLSKGKISVKKKTPEQIQENKEEREKMWEFYEYLWNKAGPNKRCKICDCPIGGENRSIYHDHLLEKSKYPEFKYEEKNMILICSDCHELKTIGFPKELHQDYIYKAKKELLYMD